MWYSSVTLHYQQCFMTIWHVQPCTIDLGKGHSEIWLELPVSIKTSSICAGVPSLLSFCFQSNVTVNCVKTWCCMLTQGHMLNRILHSRSNVGSKDSTTSSSAFYAHQMQRDRFGSISHLRQFFDSERLFNFNSGQQDTNNDIGSALDEDQGSAWDSEQERHQNICHLWNVDGPSTMPTCQL